MCPTLSGVFLNIQMYRSREGSPVQKESITWDRIAQAYEVALADPELQGIGSNRVPDAHPDFFETSDEVFGSLEYSVKNCLMRG